VDVTNKNRQLAALDSTVGAPKAAVLAARCRDINPDLELDVRRAFLGPDGAADALLRPGGPAGPCAYDYVVDCIDSVAPKRDLIVAAVAAGARVASSMGAGGRLDPSRVRVCDLSQTYGDPLAANMRKQLRKRGVVAGVAVAWSDEPVRPGSLMEAAERSKFKRSFYGTCAYMPALFGLSLAAWVVADATGNAIGGGYAPLAPSVGEHAATIAAAKAAKRNAARARSAAATAAAAATGQPPAAAKLPAAAAAAPQPPRPGQPAAAPFAWAAGLEAGVGMGLDGTGL